MDEMVKFMKLLYNVMLDNEVDEKYINQMMDEIETGSYHVSPLSR